MPMSVLITAKRVKLCGNDLIEKYPDGGTVAILEATKQNSVNDRITDLSRQLPKRKKDLKS